MTRPIVAFLRSKADIVNTEQYFPDIECVQTNLIGFNRMKSRIVAARFQKIWFDMSLDFIGNLDSDSFDTNERNFFLETCHGKVLKNPDNVLVKANTSDINVALEAMYEVAAHSGASWVGIPQYSFDKQNSTNTKRKRENLKLISLVANLGIKSTSVLPIVLTHKSWTESKSYRNILLSFIKDALSEFKFEYVWIVDASLDDDNIAKPKNRFMGLVNLHTEVRQRFEEIKIIAGPYWGMNLVLWARGFSDYLAINPCGSGQYYAGGLVRSGAKRVAIPTLRRVTKVGDIRNLKNWLAKSLEKEGLDLQTKTYFKYLHDNLSKMGEEHSKRQIAEFYSLWIEKIMSLPKLGRALGLYQDLSDAYIKGKMLPRLPTETGAMSRASHVAESLMLSVLGED